MAVCAVSCFCLVAPVAAHAETCTTANPAANINASKEWNNDAEIEANFTAAREKEGCKTPLKLPPGYDSMTPQEQMLWLFNNEREVRGLGTLKLDPTLMSQISLNHDREMAQYGYANHPSPINEPGPENVDKRLIINPRLSHWTNSGEIIAFGYATSAAAVYGWIYEDEGEGWGHRDNILSAFANPWVGIGILQNAAGSVWTNYYTADFLGLEAGYKPPEKTDTHGPEMGQITYNAGTATVTGVKDSPLNVNDQAPTPEAERSAAVTGVVFYTNKIVESPESSGKFNTVSAKETSTGTWSANITVGEGETLHAVAVDGSGNFTDETIKAAPPPNPTGGTWVNTVGHEGYDLAAWGGSSDVSELPAGVSVSLNKGGRYVWAAQTGETRALQSPDGLTREAATYYDPNEIQLGLKFTSAYSGELHLYALDWETTARRETITVAGKATTLSSEFHEGAWVNVPITVKAGETVPITVTRSAGLNAVLSGIFLGGTGAPPTVASEQKPQGAWVNTFGHEGYDLAAWGGSTDISQLPAGDSVSLTQGSRYEWAAQSGEAQALQSPDGLTREAATYYDPNQVRLSMKFAKAFTGNLNIYAVDWDTTARRETISVGNQTADLSASFKAGAWVSFPISVQAGETLPIVVSRTAGSNAVLSGIFLGGEGSPPTVESTSAPQGAWVNTFGHEGYDLAAWGSSSDVSQLPAGDSVSVTQGSRFQWAAQTGEAQALQSPDGLTREAATYYESNQLRISLKFAKAFTGELHLYAVDWDTTARRETISVGNQTADLSASFKAGAWVSFPISVAEGETVPIVVSRTAGSNAVLSGIFLGGTGAPPTVASESTPQGNWVGTYGSKGSDLAAWNAGTSDLVEMPGAEVNLTQGSRFQWSASTADVRALESPNKATREAATYYSPTQVRISLKFTKAFTGTVHLYAVDWETTARRETVSVGAQTAELSSSFNSGAWVSFPISAAEGETVPIVVDRTAGLNAVLSGIFLE